MNLLLLESEARLPRLERGMSLLPPQCFKASSNLSPLPFADQAALLFVLRWSRAATFAAIRSAISSICASGADS